MSPFISLPVGRLRTRQVAGLLKKRREPECARYYRCMSAEVPAEGPAARLH